MFSEGISEPRRTIGWPGLRSRFSASEARATVLLAAPITGAALVNMGMTITDTLMMGWMGPQALAAGAVISDVHSLVFYFVAGIAGAVAPLVARAVGAGNWKEAGQALHHGIFAAGLLAPVTFSAVWHAAEFVRVFGVDPVIVELGRPYAHAIAFGATAMLFVTVLKQMFDAIGRPKVFLVAVMSALPLNALANLVFMFGIGPVPEFGLAGAGIASSLVAVALLIGLAAYGATNAETRRLKLIVNLKGIQPGRILEIFRIGLPIGFFTIGEVGIFLLSTIVVSLFGVEALAAHAITLRTAGVIYAIPVGLTQAATVRVGHALGVGETIRIRQSVRAVRTIGAIAGLGIFLVLSASALVLFVWASGAEKAIPLSVSLLLTLLAALNLAQGFVAPVTGIMRALKRTQVPMVASLTGYWGIGMPIGALAAFGLDLEALGIWTGLAVGVAATAAVLNWQMLRVVSQELVSG